MFISTILNWQLNLIYNYEHSRGVFVPSTPTLDKSLVQSLYLGLNQSFTRGSVHPCPSLIWSHFSNIVKTYCGINFIFLYLIARELWVFFCLHKRWQLMFLFIYFYKRVCLDPTFWNYYPIDQRSCPDMTVTVFNITLWRVFFCFLCFVTAAILPRKTR